MNVSRETKRNKKETFEMGKTSLDGEYIHVPSSSAEAKTKPSQSVLSSAAPMFKEAEMEELEEVFRSFGEMFAERMRPEGDITCRIAIMHLMSEFILGTGVDGNSK
jgi:hypothetical protein